MLIQRSGLSLWDMDRLSRLERLEVKDDTIPLLTIGYEGYSIDEFIGCLKNFHVDYLFDVREIPFSHKKGFSKTPLKTALTENAIRYQHFKELGSPKEIRDQLHSDSNYDVFFENYEAYLQTQRDTMEIASAAIEGNANKIFCLLCFEKNPEICHRSVLARELATMVDKDVEIINI